MEEYRLNDSKKSRILQGFATEATGKLAKSISALGSLFDDSTLVVMRRQGFVVDVGEVRCVYGSIGGDQRYAIGDHSVCWDAFPMYGDVTVEADPTELAILLVATTIGTLPAVPIYIWEEIFKDDWDDMIVEKSFAAYISGLPKSHIMACGLCESRHEMPVTSYLFPQVVENPCDSQSLYGIANRSIPENITSLRLYVSGLTQALTATIRVCQDRRIDLILMHYDRDKDVYYQEPILTYAACDCGERYECTWDTRFCPYCGEMQILLSTSTPSEK